MPSIDPQRLTTAMEIAGVNPTELARRVGVTKDYISHLTAGRRRLKRNPILRRKIADALGVPVDWIEGRWSNPEDLAS